MEATGQAVYEEVTEDGAFLTEEEIKAVVSGYRMWTEELQERIAAVKDDLVSLNRGQAGAVREDGMPYPSLYTEKRRQDSREELMTALNRLERQRIRIRRVFLAYMTLPLQEYQMMHALYEEKIPWRRISQHIGISKQRAVERRNLAIHHIRERFEAEEKKERGQKCEWDFPWNGMNLNMISGGC